MTEEPQRIVYCLNDVAITIGMLVTAESPDEQRQQFESRVPVIFSQYIQVKFPDATDAQLRLWSAHFVADCKKIFGRFQEWQAGEETDLRESDP